jgi:Fe-S-cluster-containing hydrogenase component 2
LGQFRNFLGILEKLDSENVHVRQERCAVVRNRHATCSRCADACTSGCISVVDGQLVIDKDKCIGCGTCATVCPTGAIESENPTDAELFSQTLHAMRAANGTAVIACERMLERARGAYDTEKVSEVVCLGRVDESLIALMALAGGKRVVLVGGGCEKCPHRVGIDTAELVCSTVNELLMTWNNPLRACVAQKLPGIVRKRADEEYDREKRAVFMQVTNKATTATADAVEDRLSSPLGKAPEQEHEEQPEFKVNEAGVLPQHIPTRRKRLLKTLSEMGEPKDEVVATRLWGDVRIDKSVCKSCQMCATFCPTGALTRFKDKDGTVGIEHYAGCCVKCRCCTDICPNDAITLSDEVRAMDLMHGFVEKYPMSEPEVLRGGVHQTRDVMQKLAAKSQVLDH